MGCGMLYPLFRTLAKVAVASPVVGTILTHFGITAEQLMRELGLSTERIEARPRLGVAKRAPGSDSDHTYMVRSFFISSTPQKQQRLATGPEKFRLALPKPHVRVA